MCVQQHPITEIGPSHLLSELHEIAPDSTGDSMARGSRISSIPSFVMIIAPYGSAFIQCAYQSCSVLAAQSKRPRASQGPSHVHMVLGTLWHFWWMVGFFLIRLTVLKACSESSFGNSQPASKLKKLLIKGRQQVIHCDVASEACSDETRSAAKRCDEPHT